MQKIPLYRRDGSVADHVHVDDQDFDNLNQYRWFRHRDGYAVRASGGGSTVWMHRQLLGLHTGDPRQGDHVNRVRLDNRRANLRIVTRQENRQNVPSYTGSTSVLRGVSWDAAKQRWKVGGTDTTGRVTYLGRYDDEELAGAVAFAWRALILPHAIESGEFHAYIAETQFDWPYTPEGLVGWLRLHMSPRLYAQRADQLAASPVLQKWVLAHV